ncbi:MAG: hypothetical protein WAM60_02155 [Candidatus Promineifilaceae bacterium]
MQIHVRKILSWLLSTIILLVLIQLPQVENVQATPSYVPPTHVTVKMYRLVSPDEADPNQGIFAGEIYVPIHICTAQSTVYGCTAIENNSNYPYPYENDNPVLVSIETDYLLDVVSQEMGSAEFHSNARYA